MNTPILNQYDPANAAALCKASKQAYAESQINDPATDTHVNITSTATDVIIGFRGSADIRNWLTDIDCAFDHIDGCKIHRGFYGAMDSIFDDVWPHLQSGTGKRIWLTGHSLGGALAQAFAFEHFNRYHRSETFAGIYTFGGPRVGNIDFRYLYNWSALGLRTFRVIHSGDIVPHVPYLLNSYRHAGHEIFFDDGVGSCCADAGIRGGDAAPPYREDAPITWKIKCELYANILRAGRMEFAPVADHHIDTYLELFTEANKGNEEKNQNPIPAPSASLPSRPSGKNSFPT